MLFLRGTSFSSTDRVKFVWPGLSGNGCGGSIANSQAAEDAAGTVPGGMGRPVTLVRRVSSLVDDSEGVVTFEFTYPVQTAILCYKSYRGPSLFEDLLLILLRVLLILLRVLFLSYFPLSAGSYQLWSTHSLNIVSQTDFPST